VNPEDWRHQLDLQWATHQFILPPLDNTTDIDQLWNDCFQALRHTFRRAHNQAYEGRNDRPKQHTRQTKGTNPGTYLRHSHNSANSHHSTSIRLARLRRQHRRHHEYWDIHHNTTQDDSTRQLRHKLQYNLRQLGCPHPLWPSNQHHMLTWLQQEIQSIESQQQQARITAWRRRLRNSTHRTWKWLGRGKFTAQLAYISESNGEIIHTDQLIDRVHRYWQAIWPQPTEEDLQQQAILAQQQPWPAVQAPQLPTIQPHNIRRTAKRLAGKARGLDGWSGALHRHLKSWLPFASTSSKAIRGQTALLTGGSSALPSRANHRTEFPQADQPNLGQDLELTSNQAAGTLVQTGHAGRAAWMSPRQGHSHCSHTQHCCY
jgi:hypothetical protein